MGAIWVVILFGCRELWLSLGGMESTALRIGIVGIVLAAGLWLGFRLVNWPRFAEFLINVESELKKVSWPTKTELWRASMVVVFTIVFMSVLLFGFDILWDQIGRLLRFIFG
jgi:preprotein translocase subunit SecE